MPGKVILAGAGCGGRETLTCQVKEAIQNCDILVYDDLISPDILELAKTEKIYVGKRSGKHHKQQNEIETILKEEAEKGKTVLRLKGGDPFVFGRGREERDFLESFDIETEVMPGISSCIAIAERAGIPVTDREAASGFMVLTGKTRTGTIPQRELETAARFDGTIIILMGLTSLEAIAETLLANGKNPDTPAAILSSPQIDITEVIIASLETIARKAEKDQPSSPAIIVIGDVVKFARNPKENRDKMVTVEMTGTEAFTERVRKHLPAWIKISQPVIRTIIPIQTDLAWLKSDGPGWLVFVSPNGSEIFLQQIQDQNIDIRILSRWKIAAIGETTAAPLKKAGLYPDFMPASSTTEALACELKKQTAKAEGTNPNIYTFRAENGSPRLEQTLKAKRTSLYRIQTENKAEEKNERVQPVPDILVFASPDAVNDWHKTNRTIDRQTKVLCLSEVTGKRLQTWTDHPYVCPAAISADSLTEKIIETAEGLPAKARRKGR